MNSVRGSKPGRRLALLVLLSFAAIAVMAQAAAAREESGSDGSDTAGHVYTLTNNTGGNAVVDYQRLPDGSLQQVATVPTGGTGGQEQEHGCTAMCPFIDAQNEVILSKDGRLLFAVNPGSHTISSFRVTEDGLKLVDVADSHGDFPTSVTTHGDLLYVLNSKSLRIAGFQVSDSGELTFIPGSDQNLSSGAQTFDVPPKQIQFDRTGRVLAVTLLAVPVIDTFKVSWNGVAGPAQANATANPLPFAFSVTPRNQLVVAEIVDADHYTPVGLTSTYQLNPWSGKLSYIDTAPTNGFAPCWTAITRNGRYVYVVNTGGGAASGATVSVFRVHRSGNIDLIQVTPHGAPGPLPGGDEVARTDDVLSSDNRYLYVLVPGIFGPSKIDIFKVGDDGLLTQIGSTPPNSEVGFSGLAAS